MLPEENIELYNRLRRRAFRGAHLVIVAGLILLLALIIGEEYKTIYLTLVITWVILKLIGIVMLVDATIKRQRYFNNFF